jgi:hypothetical protein
LIFAFSAQLLIGVEYCPPIDTGRAYKASPASLTCYGRHHGIEGFRDFSNLRGVYEFAKGDALINIVPPYGEGAEMMLEQFKKPPESEC